MENQDLFYLKSLSKQFPTIADAATEIINLQAIMSLPKGTEHFLTDIHGEAEQFQHVLKNGSGSDVSLKNWYVYSDSGNDLFIFGDTMLPAGGNVVLGTKSSEDGYDVYWDDKNVISNKKEDIISLYDENGNLIWAD